MNKKVVLTMIILTWIILFSFLIAKLFFGYWFVATINNDIIISIGNFVDNNYWLKMFCYLCTTLLTYWLYLCAVCQQWFLKWKQVLICFPIIVIFFIIKIFNFQIGNSLDYVCMFGLPFLLNAKYKNVVLIFTAHILSLLLVVYCRNFDVGLLNLNFITTIITIIDGYLWLLLYYFYMNKYKKGDDEKNGICNASNIL